VDGLGAKAIRRIGDSATQAGDIVANGVYLLRYDAAYNSAAGAWILLNAAGASAATTSAAGIVELATAAEAFQASSTALAVTPAGLANLYSIALNNAIEIADLKGSRLNMAGGIADAYDSETDVDTATSTNESYDSGNDLYSPTAGSATPISGATGTNIGDLTGGGGLAAIFDGTTSQNDAASGQTVSGGGTTAYAGKNYSLSPKRITQVVAYPSNASSWFSAADGTLNVTLTLYGKNGGAPANSTDGTSLGSVGPFSEDGASRTITSSDTTTLWDYVWVGMLSSGSTGTRYMAELIFSEPGVPNNMTLVSNAFTATAVPTTARIATFIDPQESITINTDFTAEVTRDGGTTWTAVTLALVSNPVGTVEQYEGTADISGQPSDSDMRYRLKTLNNKDIDVTGTVFQWS
jgi:predicted RecA/RadA family phage recombinase